MFSVEEKLMALEIIKIKYVDCYWVRYSSNCRRYNLTVGSKQQLKRKEYDLVKGVLNETNNVCN